MANTTGTDENESKIAELSSQVQNLGADDLILFVSQLEVKWSLNRKNDSFVPLLNGFRQFFRPDELDESGVPSNIDMERVAEQRRRTMRVLGELYHRSVSLGVFDDDTVDVNENEFKVSVRINRLIDMVDDAYETVFRYCRQYERINHPTYVPVNPEADASLFRCTTMSFDDISSYQQLLLSMLKGVYDSNYRRYRDQCCKQIVSADGYGTKAWKPVMSIHEFVYKFAEKETRFEVWKNLTSKGSSARDCIGHLSECKDMQFPEIVKSRNVWSFQNGLFDGKVWNSKLGKYECLFYPYESDQFRCMNPTIASSKYFDKHFTSYDHVSDWADIETPNFQAILDYQCFTDEVSKWMYVMGGRLCFDVSDLDSWQVIPFLKGIARSGKSTVITKVFKKFYEPEDVRTLSNNIERKFGLEAIYDGFMFIAPEVKGDLALEQAEFQSLVSGEDVSVARKNKKAKSVEWKTPGILGGNEVPNWKDNSGSVLRRILPWNFGKQVQEADPHLDEKLDKELPAILLKCVRAYLDYAQKYSDQDIWNVVPKYFKNIQTQVAMVTNSLQNFLASEKVTYGKDLCVPQKKFVQYFNQHCQENNLGRFKFNPDFYAGPFSSRQVEVRTEARTYNGNKLSSQPFIFGIDVVEEKIQLAGDDV